MADVYSAIILDTDYWDGTTSWAGETSEANRDTKYSTRRFTSIAAWQSDRDGNGNAVDDEYGTISGPWASTDTSKMHFYGWTPQGAHLECPLTLPDGDNTARHDGIYGNVANSFINASTVDHSIQDSGLSLTLDGLQFDFTALGNSPLAAAAIVDFTIKNNIFKSDSGNRYAIAIDAASGTIEIYNNVIFGAHSREAIALGAGTCKVYNNTLDGSGAGGGNQGIEDGLPTSSTVKNNAVLNHADDFSGTFDTIEYNASDDGDGTNAVDWANEATDWALNFNAYATNDYTIGSDGASASIVGAGTGPSSDASVPTTDIIGNSRSGATCTIGAFEYQAAGQELNFYTKTDSQFNTPSMILNNSRKLKSLAPAQFSTDAITLKNNRALNSSVSAQFVTADIALLKALNMHTKADSKFITADIATAINRILNTKINNVFTIDSAMLNLQRSLKTKPFAQYVTSDIDITVSGLIKFFSRISCGFTTSDIIAAIYRALNTKVDTVFTAESIILAVQRSLYSTPSAQFITSDINVIISGLIEFYSRIDCTFSTSNIDLAVTGIIEFFSRAECAFSTTDVMLAVQRALAARAASTFTTSDIDLSIGVLPLEFYTKIDCAFNASDIVLLLTRKLNSKISAEYVTVDIALKALLRFYGKADCIFSTKDINLISDELGIILNTSTTSITKERIFTSITADRMTESITTDRQVFNKLA